MNSLVKHTNNPLLLVPQSIEQLQFVRLRGRRDEQIGALWLPDRLEAIPLPIGHPVDPQRRVTGRGVVVDGKIQRLVAHAELDELLGLLVPHLGAVAALHAEGVGARGGDIDLEPVFVVVGSYRTVDRPADLERAPAVAKAAAGGRRLEVHASDLPPGMLSADIIPMLPGGLRRQVSAILGETTRASLELPFPAGATLVLLRAPAGAQALDVTLIRGPRDAREERAPEVAAEGIGLYTLRIDPSSTEGAGAVLRLRRPRHR